MAWDKYVIWGNKNASEIDLNVGEMADENGIPVENFVLNPQIMTVQDAMCTVLVPGVFYTYDKLSSVDELSAFEQAILNGIDPAEILAEMNAGGISVAKVLIIALLILVALGLLYRTWVSMQRMRKGGNSIPPAADDEKDGADYDLRLNAAAMKAGEAELPSKGAI